jgi:hypothetical protein
MDHTIENLKSQVAPLARFVELFATSLGQPGLRHIHDRGFRYTSPDLRHFCLLKLVRVVSGLNASVELARAGFAQEIGVLMRTVVECATHIEYVLDPNDSEEHCAEVERYVHAFFQDSSRDPSAEIKRAQVPQGKIHKTLGHTLDTYSPKQEDIDKPRRPASQLYSNVYRIFSNYVHAKYPETMDLYGGTPGKFHLNGMRHTPKDWENLETLQTFIGTASTAIRVIVHRLKLQHLIETEPMLTRWWSK